jgi:hypothetical protein
VLDSLYPVILCYDVLITLDPTLHIISLYYPPLDRLSRPDLSMYRAKEQYLVQYLEDHYTFGVLGGHRLKLVKDVAEVLVR